MRLQYKIIILLFSIFGIIIFTFLSYQYIQYYQKKLIGIENTKNQEIVIDKVLQLNRIKYEQLINDNSGWDDMVSFAAKPDKEWAKDNVDFFVNSFKLSFVLVYNKDMQLMYSFGDSTSLKTLALPQKNTIKGMFQQTPYSRYFQYAGNQLFEIFGAIIVPAFDSDYRKTPPQGYLFLGKIWDKDYLNQHAQTTSFKTELIPATNLGSFKKDKKYNYINRDLFDYNGNKIALLSFSKEDTIQHDLSIFLNLSLFFTFIAFGAMIFFFFYLKKMVLTPIAQVKQTLDTHNPQYIASFKTRSDEVKRLGDLICRSFEQEELLKAKNAELLDTNATKDKLFSIIAHDLKNPVGNILLLSQLLQSGNEPCDENSRELIGMIENQAQETLNLLGTLFEWAKSQTGQISFNPEAVDLYSSVSRTTEHLSPSAVMKNISIENQCSGDILVYADINMLDTVLRNLITNAIKFTSDGGYIRIYNNRPKNDKVEITVEDNGIGMDEKIISKLFRVNSGHTSNGTNNEKGTGLGLILCKEFIEKHGGSIRVISYPGKGSKFIFTFPLSHIAEMETV